MATGHSNTKGQASFLKSQYLKNKSAGEKAMAFEFQVRFIGYENLSVLVRSAQFPAMGRSDVEDYGAYGLKFTQHGALENSGETTFMCVETIKGDVLAALREIILEKKYIDIEIKHTPESTGGKSGKELVRVLRDCKVRSDAVEMSTEDTAALVKPTFTAIFNWID